MKQKPKQNNFTPITIPTPLYKKLKEKIKGTGFLNVSSYITYLLNEILTKEEEKETQQSPYTKEEEEKIKARLEALGYIN